jgi:hypothetical protein
LLLIALFTCTAAVAVEVDGLYDAEVPVAGQEPMQRQDAMRAALAEVLVKVSGDRNIGSHPAVPALVSNAPQYVQQFVYRNAPLAPGQRPTQPPARNLWVRFDHDALNQELRKANISIWGRARPALLLWLDLHDSTDRSIVGADNRPEWKQFIDQVAKARGVPLILPALDAQDLANRQVVDVWNAAPEDVWRVSARYQAEAVLVGRVEVMGQAWAATWTMYEPNEQHTWSVPAESRDAAVLDGLQGAIDAIAQRYTASGGVATAGGSMLQVLDVRTVEDYARVTRYLESLASVARLQLLRVEAESLIFHVDAQGGLTRLANDIRLGNTLVAEPTAKPEGTADPDAPARFRLMR